jgi:hypothetical protein
MLCAVQINPWHESLWIPVRIFFKKKDITGKLLYLGSVSVDAYATGN